MTKEHCQLKDGQSEQPKEMAAEERYKLVGKRLKE
jgi:hypothetical protein